MHFSNYFQCDGVPLDLIRGPSMEGIAMLNIPSIYGGSNLWGDTMKAKKRKKVAGETDRECSSGSMSSADLSVTVQGRSRFYFFLSGIMLSVICCRLSV